MHINYLFTQPNAFFWCILHNVKAISVSLDCKFYVVYIKRYSIQRIQNFPISSYFSTTTAYHPHSLYLSHTYNLFTTSSHPRFLPSHTIAYFSTSTFISRYIIISFYAFILFYFLRCVANPPPIRAQKSKHPSYANKV